MCSGLLLLGLLLTKVKLPPHLALSPLSVESSGYWLELGAQPLSISSAFPASG